MFSTLSAIVHPVIFGGSYLIHCDVIFGNGFIKHNHYFECSETKKAEFANMGTGHKAKKETKMTSVTATKIVNAPLSEVWATWDDFANIADFNPGVKKSYLLNNSVGSGLGAQRQCDFNDNKNYVREKVVGYTPNKQMVIDIYEGSIPVKDAGATINFKSLGENRTEVEMIMKFTPKMGVIGKLMTPIMKKQFGGAINGLLAGNAGFVEKRQPALAS